MIIIDLFANSQYLLRCAGNVHDIIGGKLRHNIPAYCLVPTNVKDFELN